MICTVSGSAVQLRSIPAVTTVSIDQAIVDLNTGVVFIVYDDGTGNISNRVQTSFTLDGARLASIQTFVKTQLGLKYGISIT